MSAVDTGLVYTLDLAFFDFEAGDRAEFFTKLGGAFCA